MINLIIILYCRLHRNLSEDRPQISSNILLKIFELNLWHTITVLYTFVNDTSEKITRSSWTLMDFLLPNFKIITGNLRKPYIFNPLPALLNITVRCKIMI